MSNKVKYNLKNVHAAKLTTEVVEGVTNYSYATPKAIPGAVSLSLDEPGGTLRVESDPAGETLLQGRTKRIAEYIQ